MITIEVNDKALTAALAGLARRTADLTPAMQAIGEYMTEITKRRFATATAPDGTRWAANRPSTIARYLARFSSSFTKTGKLGKAGALRAGAKKPLTGETKSLATTIHYRAGRMRVEIGSPMEYAAVQQFGAKKGSFGRTRRGAPIPWGDIPARPFLGLSDADRRGVLGIVQRHVMRGKSLRRAP